MKKVITTLGAGALALTLAACSDSAETAGVTDTTASESIAATENTEEETSAAEVSPAADDAPEAAGADLAVGDISQSIGGSYEEMMESFTDLLLALLVALGLVYFILAAQFESFLMPVIIMMILPVAFSGALFALPLTGRDLSMISLVALIMLAGTVVNNSIVLVDYIKTRREMGESREDAILHACPLRIRPIMMTTLTTVLAMVPMAMAMGDTLEMMSDMGITMISGMIISTIVTLLFTPVFYSVIDDLPRHFRRRKHTDTPEPPADEAAALPVEG